MVNIRQAKPSMQKCPPHSFATVNWRARLASNNKLVEDTKIKFGATEEIQIGNYQAVRCLDLTLAQMRPGDTFRI